MSSKYITINKLNMYRICHELTIETTSNQESSALFLSRRKRSFLLSSKLYLLLLRNLFSLRILGSPLLNNFVKLLAGLEEDNELGVETSLIETGVCDLDVGLSLICLNISTDTNGCVALRVRRGLSCRKTPFK